MATPAINRSSNSSSLKQTQRAAAKRTAWILLSVAIVFFIGVIVRFWLLR
ncbi:MAG TPA: cytochrome oxidase small assembly protein [Burkholderiaceae bacterium]|nr:cytochrome oxidase small assembly protein [Burkholderiaceae bacterium]